MADKFQLKALITGVDKLSPVLSGVRKNAAVLRKQLNSSGLGKITFMDAIQGGAIATPFVMGVQAAIGFESAMADVKKVVNFETPAQFKEMSEDVLSMSERLPMAAEGIAQIVAAGGQSGIAREDLKQFAEDAVKMGVAFDQTADESGKMMATWRTAFRLTQDGVVELADQINYLGNSGPVNTKQLSSIVTEVGALGEVAGFSSAQIAAIGATMVGVKQDVAATGIKNFMLAMTKGTAATKSQAEAFKSLRLDSKKVAEGMQKDSQGTMLDLLKRISEVDAAKRPALLTNLFGSESVAAITPLLTNLQLLKSNLASVGDSTKYAGSMQGEYTSRAATTANALQQLKNRVTRLGITVGSVLLPPLNDFMATVGPIITGVTQLAGAHPWLIKSIIGAAVGFTVLRLATAGATAALVLMDGVAKMSVIGLVVRGVAIAAGVLIANWSTVAPFFSALWELIKAYTVPAWDVFKAFASWTPLGMIIENWEPVSKFFKDLWDTVSKYIEPIMKFMGMDDGGEGITAKVQRAAYAKNQLNGEVLGQGDGALLVANAGAQAAANQQAMAARFSIPSTGDLLKAPVPGSLNEPIAQAPELMPEATRVASLMRNPANQPLPGMAPLALVSVVPGTQVAQASGTGRPSLSAGGSALPAGSLPQSRGSLVQAAAATAAARTELEGSMVVRFENAPPGMRVDPAKTNQPGLSVSPSVGYRSLGREAG
ncbi:phage tail tape measure protein [Pseudomonas sp. HLS-6]|uniref:phage tail tape measure protein n=1 Tax=Pseudomonas sp. HLS-6 TaxID=2049589 RepID=UPI000C6BB0DB|nr:phage tail tape measure protein [Pseudomonas sp. HLS-6]ATR82149.1 phage tail tape measure protein [Pseudomonas sp. HLS-6]